MTIAASPSVRFQAFRAWPLLIVLSALVVMGIAWAMASLGARDPDAALPLPFGPARDGVIVLDIGSTLIRVDPETGSTVRLGSGDLTIGPEFSNDGRRLMFAAPSGPADARLYVANADGSDVPRDLGPAADFEGGAWAPDGARFAVARGRRLAIVDIDSQATERYDLGFDIGAIQWRPNHDEVLVERVIRGESTIGQDEHVAWYLVAADGTSQRMVAAALGTWSPDGSTIAHAVSPGPGLPDRIHLLDLDTGVDREVTFAGSDGTGEWPVAFSPDGTKLLIERSTDTVERYGERWRTADPRCVGENDPGRIRCIWFRHVVVPVAGGGPVVVLGDADHRAHGGPGAGGEAIFSPDGTKVLAAYTQANAGMWLFDASTGQAERMPWYRGGGYQGGGFGGMTWQRLAP